MSDSRQATQTLLAVIRDSLNSLGPLMEEDLNRVTLDPITDIDTFTRLRHDPAIIRELAQFDADLKTLDEMDATLRTLKHRLLLHRNEYQAQLAPISVLPVEILRFVFVHIMTSEIGPFGFVRGTPKYVASITHVCRRWRVIALEQGQLWTHINANWPSDQLATWLSRSTLPLRVSYVHTSPGPVIVRQRERSPPEWDGVTGLTTDNETRSVNALVSHSHRWKAAKLSFEGGVTTPAFGHILNDSDLRQLHTLSIHGPAWSGTLFAEVNAGALPTLHSLEMFRSHIGGLPTLCHQLVHLVVDPSCLLLEQWAETLPLCNVLEYLEIGWTDGYFSPPHQSFFAPTLVPMEKLKTFIVRNIDTDVFTSFIGWVRSPHLTTFSMGMSTNYQLKAADFSTQEMTRSLREFLAAHETLTTIDVGARAGGVNMVIQSLLGEGSMFGSNVMQSQSLLLPGLHVLSIRLVGGDFIRIRCVEELTHLATLCARLGGSSLKVCVPRCDDRDEVWLRSKLVNVEVGTRVWGKIDKFWSKK